MWSIIPFSSGIKLEVLAAICLGNTCFFSSGSVPAAAAYFYYSQASNMDQVSLYRDGSSISPGLHPARLLVNNFYLSHGPGGGGTSAGFEQCGGTQPVTDMALTGKIDQMMNMLSST